MRNKPQQKRAKIISLNFLSLFDFDTFTKFSILFFKQTLSQPRELLWRKNNIINHSSQSQVRCADLNKSINMSEAGTLLLTFISLEKKIRFKKF